MTATSMQRAVRGVGAQPPRDLVAVHLRHADVEERDLGRERRAPPRAPRRRRRRRARRGRAPRAGAPRLSAKSTLSSARSTRCRRPSPRDRGRGAAPASSSARATRGRRTMNSLPCPAPSLVASMRAAVQLDQPAREREARRRGPPALRSSERSTCDEHVEDARVARARSRCRCPSRATTISSPPASRAAISIRPPGSVYLAALLSRLENTCASRVASPSTGSGSLRQVDLERVRRAPR